MVVNKYAAVLSLFLYSSVAYAQSPDLQKARELKRNGKTVEAISVYQKLLPGSAGNLAVMQELGDLYLSAGRNEDAYEIAGKGLKLNPQHESLNILRAKAAINLGKAKDAIGLMDALIARKPDNYLAYHIKGKALEADNNIHLAIGLYSKSIGLNARFLENYIARGGAFYAISRNEQAIADYSKVLEIDVKNAEVFNWRGLSYARLKKSAEAFADFNKAIELKYWYALVNRAQLYEDANEYEKALSDYNMAAANIPDFPDTYYGLTVSYNKLKKYDQALKSIQKAIALVQDRSHFFAEYAITLISLDRNAEALLQADKTLELDSRNPNGYIYKAIALSNLTRFDEAVVAISKGVNAFPDLSVMYMIRANVYNQQGKRSMADADNQKAKELIK